MMKCRESEIVEVLCGVFADQYDPLTRAEFWKLYHQCGDSVEQMTESDDERIAKLMERSGAIAFGREKLDQMGVRITTFVDDDFPHRLYEKLGDFCPPLLYVCGETSLLEQKYVGYVGSRNIQGPDIGWTEERVKKNIHDGYGVVTGGAKGIDSVAANCALNMGGKVILFLPDNIKEKLRESFVQKHIWDGNLLVYSHISPLAVKSRHSFVAAAMERNKYIYSLSSGTVVVRSDLKKGGTWSGAVEALKHHWATVFVWDNADYPGNQELIRMGARALSNDGSLKEAGEDTTKNPEEQKVEHEAEEYKQMTLFDLMDHNSVTAKKRVSII
ncbi:MAG: DNA-protecting protein DprA [Lachnospiraceae bacterium]|nr:DNA-protecting protein DprA [Lachnospiraceae bacterium]